MDALSQIKQVSQEDLHHFLQSDHRDFKVLNVSFKQILSTSRTSVIISKPSAKNFYLKDKSKPAEAKPQPTLSTDCRQDTQNCSYFSLFSSHEKRLHTILTNSETPEEQLTFHFWAIGSNSDPAKAKGCAETYAIKYFLTKFFLIMIFAEI